MADAGALIKQLRDAYKKQDLKTSKTLLSQIKVVTVAPRRAGTKYLSCIQRCLKLH